MHISIVFIVRLDHNTSTCSLACDGRTMPSASSTVAVVESQRQGERHHGGRRALKLVSPFACTSVSSSQHAWPKTYLYACWLATAVPCRQRTAQSPLWSHNGAATAATVGRGRSRESRPSHAYHRVESPSRLVWREDTYSIVLTVRSAHIASICLLARDGRTMPSAISTVTVVESQWWGDRRLGGPRSLKGESPFVCIS